MGTGTKFVDVIQLSDNGTKVLQNTHRNIENSIRLLHSKFNIKLESNRKRGRECHKNCRVGYETKRELTEDFG